MPGSSAEGDEREGRTTTRRLGGEPLRVELLRVWVVGRVVMDRVDGDVARRPRGKNDVGVRDSVRLHRLSYD